MEGWVNLGELIMCQPRVEPTTAWLKVRHRDCCTTKIPQIPKCCIFASVFVSAIEMCCDFCLVRCETVYVVAVFRDLCVRCAWSAAILQTCCRNTLTRFMPMTVQRALPLHPTPPPQYTVSDLDLVLDFSLYLYIWIDFSTSLVC